MYYLPQKNHEEKSEVLIKRKDSWDVEIPFICWEGIVVSTWNNRRYAEGMEDIDWQVNRSQAIRCKDLKRFDDDIEWGATGFVMERQ
ncbi:MAG: hypothetical protein KC588_18850 [Nitrospira sp.]|nr:hypothetical protein [Nitrospira sp.]